MFLLVLISPSHSIGAPKFQEELSISSSREQKILLPLGEKARDPFSWLLPEFLGGSAST